MKQSKKHSVLETITQTIIGLITSFLIQIVIYPLLDIPVSLNQNFIITIVFFVVSLLRGYLIRRYYENKKM